MRRRSGSSLTASRSRRRTNTPSLLLSLASNASRSTILRTDSDWCTSAKCAHRIATRCVPLHLLQGEGEARFIVVTKRRERQPQGSNTVGLQPTDDKSWRARNQEEKKKAAQEPTLRIQPVRQPKGPDPGKGFSDVCVFAVEPCEQCLTPATCRSTVRRASSHRRPHPHPHPHLYLHLRLYLHRRPSRPPPLGLRLCWGRRR